MEYDETLNVVYEDNHLVVVNKPFGVLTHGDKTGDLSMEERVRRYVKKKYNKPGNVYLRSVHRIDRPVSGALILARTSKGHERMARQFREQKVEKTYWALTVRSPIPPAGIVHHYLVKDTKRNVVNWLAGPSFRAREAVTHYRQLAFIEPFYLLELIPKTGRSHQLRVALRSKRCPIAGDVKYNGRKISNPRALLLHCRKMRFMHPTKDTMVEVVAGLPDLEEWQLVVASYPDAAD
jgi:23S rRNA pseudouridine1911/1915/1917 synthase